MIDYIITDPLSLCVQLHDRLLKNLHLLVDIHLFNIHALRLLLSGLERGLQHNVLLLQALLIGFDLIASLLVELLLRLAFLQFFVKALGKLLLAAGFVADTKNLRLDLEDFIILLLDQFFDSLESLITLLHAEESLLPILKQGLLAHNNLLYFDGSLLESVTCRCCLLLLRDQLGLIESLLLIESLNFLVHSIDEEILLLFGLFKIDNIFFSPVGSTASDGDFTLHNLVVLFNLF